MRRALVLAVLVAGALGVALPASAAEPGDFSVIAHRGYHADVTENTYASLKRAAGVGATAMETDLRLTRDDKMVIMHDATLVDTTTCRGWVHKRTKYDIKHHCKTEDGRPIPFVAGILARGRRYSLNLMLEIKHDPANRWTTAKFVELKNLVDNYGMADRVQVLSFYPDYLLEAEAAGFTTVYIQENGDAPDPAADGVSMNSTTMTTTPTTSTARTTGQALYGRVSDSPEDWTVYGQNGAAGVLVNDVPAYLAWRASNVG